MPLRPFKCLWCAGVEIRILQQQSSVISSVAIHFLTWKGYVPSVSIVSKCVLGCHWPRIDESMISRNGSILSGSTILITTNHPLPKFVQCPISNTDLLFAYINCNKFEIEIKLYYTRKFWVAFIDANNKWQQLSNSVIFTEKNQWHWIFVFGIRLNRITNYSVICYPVHAY